MMHLLHAMHLAFLTEHDDSRWLLDLRNDHFVCCKALSKRSQYLYVKYFTWSFGNLKL